MSNDLKIKYAELNEEYNALGRPVGGSLRRGHKEFKSRVLEATEWLDGMGEVKFALRLKCIEESITPDDLPSCPECGDPIRRVRKTRFNEACSAKCSHGVAQRNTAKTWKDNGHPMRRDEIRAVVATKLKSGEASVAYRKRRKQDWVEDRAENGVRWKKPKKDYRGETYETQLEWYAGFHPSTLGQSGKQRLSFIRHGTKGWDRESVFESRRIAREKENEVHNKLRHLDEENVAILQDGDSLGGLYRELRSQGAVGRVIGVAQATVGRWLARHNIEPLDENVKRSSYENELVSFINSIDPSIEIVRNYRGIEGVSEIDLFIPSINLGIEINGLYWHSSKFKDRMFHQAKSLAMIENGITPLMVWEDQWIEDRTRKIIKDKIRFRLGQSNRVYARKTVFTMADVSEARGFYDRHHIQGFVGSKYHAKLTHDGDIVAMMSFNMKSGVWDLTRFATSVSVVGGFSKLFTALRREFGFTEVITYALLDYSKGDVYHTNGFTLDSTTPPNYWYVLSLKRLSRQKFMKHKLTKLKNFDPTLSEKENMEANGYRRLYDCGSLKFKWQA